MRILVTGGAGFLGSHLSDSLVQEGHEVICMDNLVTGSRKNIVHLLDNPNFEFVRQDVTLGFSFEVDGIFSLACPASPIQYQRNPVNTMLTNVKGAINVLENARRNGVPVLQASTSEIYGDPLINPQTESYWGNVNTIGIRSCYDEGKRAAETLFSDYSRQFGVSTRIARIFNTYGPKMDPFDGRVVSNFIVQALTGKPITVFGDGTQIRSLCFVSDLIEGLLRLFKSSHQTPMNLGNPQSVTMIELAKEIVSLTNSKSEIIFKPRPSDDPKLREPDISLAKEILNWVPVVQRQEGLKKTIEYFLQSGLKSA
jgi:UDP-glucuronate decarboxylase